MERVVLPFSGLASWVLILGGCLATLQVLGINIQPLLTVGGVSGIVVGLSAQSVMSNMISGINLVSPCHAQARPVTTGFLMNQYQSSALFAYGVCTCAFVHVRMCELARAHVCACLCVCLSVYVCGGEGGGVGVGVGLCNGMFVVLACPGPTSSHKAPLCSLSDI